MSSRQCSFSPSSSLPADHEKVETFSFTNSITKSTLIFNHGFVVTVEWASGTKRWAAERKNAILWRDESDVKSTMSGGCGRISCEKFNHNFKKCIYIYLAAMMLKDMKMKTTSNFLHHLSSLRSCLNIKIFFSPLQHNFHHVDDDDSLCWHDISLHAILTRVANWRALLVSSTTFSRPSSACLNDLLFPTLFLVSHHTDIAREKWNYRTWKFEFSENFPCQKIVLLL